MQTKQTFNSKEEVEQTNNPFNLKRNNSTVPKNIITLTMEVIWTVSVFSIINYLASGIFSFYWLVFVQFCSSVSES